MTPFLQMRDVSKTFPGVRALKHVDLDVSRGEVLALAGENGAGKSTLMKIMTGVFRADPGSVILIEGEPLEITDPVHARALGISIIYQELSVVENLSVAENIYLAKEPLRRSGLIDKARMRADARIVLARLEINIDPAVSMGQLSIGQKQMVEIAKAIASDAKVIVMDEPTASLSHHEAVTLLRLVRQLKQDGIGLVYISHRLDELFEIADRVTILRDGATVGTLPIAEVTREILVRKMVDRDLAQLYAIHASSAQERVLLEVDGLTLRNPTAHQPKVRDVSFTLRAGEVLGFFGLIGAGRTEIMEMIFGMRPHDGRIRIEGADALIAEPGDAIAQGIGFVTEDRKSQGLVLGMNVRENFSLTHLEDYSPRQFVHKRQEAARCGEFVRALGIKTPSTEQKVVNLSGGNQQKLVIAKWVARKPKILIVDEPTRGIDIGAKAEVHALMARLAHDGMGIIAISSDLPEVLAVSDRIVVVKGGRISRILDRSDATQETVMEAETD
ncbi:sugar ABC transporter ATP-binding protein [Lichenihabitans sp. Uapishka_5]|uniref:sugar ABC transporter ATP-binding protein n=1 Tax=Lichenihabitans sp. Uapishka_5 TaxID=3037302 RepID=UPI0029E7F2C5|nr:sugar ABC transporter ATP-binding protein [Lichenihabitans sp. Uapishka_5]MDX7952618.1 sugar ABC transporter ATP-binding protein [Lichenihabitans sp. Uapishka_5]